MLNLKCVCACLCACTNYTIGCPVRNSEIPLKKKNSQESIILRQDGPEKKEEVCCKHQLLIEHSQVNETKPLNYKQTQSLRLLTSIHPIHGQVWSSPSRLSALAPPGMCEGLESDVLLDFALGRKVDQTEMGLPCTCYSQLDTSPAKHQQNSHKNVPVNFVVLPSERLEGLLWN